MDPRARRIERGGASVRVEPKVMAVLLYLAERPGEPVTRSELKARVWPDDVIGDDTLNRAVSKLRRALGEESGGPGAIETVPKVGYRLTVPVSDAPDAPFPRESLAGRIGPRRVVAGLVAALTLGGVGLAVRARGPAPEPADVELSAAPLTSSRGYESAPSVSPDGRFVAFQRYDTTRPGLRSWDIYTLPTDGDRIARPLAATDAEEYAPAWSPAGDTVAYVLQTDDDCAIVLQAALGGAVERLLECDPWTPLDLEWHPDGEALIVALTGAEPGLFRLDRSRRSLTRLTTPPAGYGRDGHPRISPDGSRLAFVRTRAEGISDVYSVALGASTPPRRLTHDNRRIGGLAWLPSGLGLLFTSNRGGNSQLWRVAADGGAPARVPMSGRNAGYLAMSAAGILVYEEYNGDSNIWEVPRGSSTAVPWSTEMRSEWSPRVSPDGSRVAFISDRSGAGEVWVSDRNGDRPRRVTDLQGAVLDPPSWSPDSRLLAYSAAHDGQFDVYTVDIATTETRKITEEPGDERAPTWSSRTEVVYASSQTGDWELWRRNLESGETRRLTRDGGFGTAAGREGLYYSRPVRAGLFELGPDGTSTLLWDEVQADDWGNYAAVGSEIAYLRVAGASEPSLRVLDLDTGRTRTIEIRATEAPGLAGVSLAPDGAILFSQIDRSESDLWLIRFDFPDPLRSPRDSTPM